MARDYQLTRGDWRRGVSLFAEKNFPHIMDIVDELKKLAKKRNAPLPHIAMRWILRNPVVGSTITGAKRPEEVEENVKAIGWDLTDEELRRIDELTLGLQF